MFRIIILILWLTTIGICKNVRDIRKEIEDRISLAQIGFSSEIYERLVYFSKICSLSSCMGPEGLIPKKTLTNGGCPQHIRFCHDEIENPTARNTKVSMVLEAEGEQLGSGCVLVDYSKKVVIMVFRSSTTVQDWYSDFDIMPTNYEPISKYFYDRLVEEGSIEPCVNCKIHRGFHKFTKSLSRDFLVRIEDILNKYSDFKLVITGHSLGAALASIAGIELRLRGYHPLILTYAPPRIFNKCMKEWVDHLFDTEKIHENIIEEKGILFDEGYFRVVHEGDYIPRIPPFYDIAGLEIHIGKLELPHEIKDLSYKGRTYETAKKEGLRDDVADFVDEWLHTYEHRSYFIAMDGCRGF